VRGYSTKVVRYLVLFRFKFRGKVFERKGGFDDMCMMVMIIKSKDARFLMGERGSPW
jgi:hypothetical protein